MDELEIDGKKYLSSRRAAKEHKYHTDYIGQLIRAGRVNGKKVGRSWYVEDESLKSYLLTENGQAAVTPPRAASEVSAPMPEPMQEPAPVEAQLEPEPQPAQEIIEPVVEEKVFERAVVFETPKPVEPVREERQVFFSTPAPKKTLTYVEDDEPLLPVLNGRPNADFVSVPVRKIEESRVESAPEASEEEPIVSVYSKPRRNKFDTKRLAVFAAIAAIVVVAAAAGTSLLATSIKVNEGQAASVGITIK